MAAPRSQMAQIICTELGVYDDTSLLLCAVYLSENYVQIWDKYPWKDTQLATELVVNPGAAFCPYPVGMDRVVSIRARTVTTRGADDPESTDGPEVPDVLQYSDARFLDPTTVTYVSQTEPDLPEQLGVVKYYEEAQDLTSGTKFIRLYPRASQQTTFLIVGKGACPGFAADTSTSVIRNIDAALMDYAAAAMLRRQRQYAKADLRYKLAQEHEANAWNLEQQQANQPRSIKATTVAGNSLSEMTDAVCMICGQWTPDYRLIIREFLRRNYQALYDVFLWPESLVMVRVPYTTEQVVLPDYIDKVIGIRGSNNQRMFPADAGLILDIQPSMFDEIGDSIGYVTLTPVAVSTLPSTTTKLVLQSTNPIDKGQVMLRGEVLSTGQELVENILLNGTTPVTSFWSYDIPLTIAKDVTLGFMTVNAASDYTPLAILPPYARESKHQRVWFLPAPSQPNGFSSIGGHSPDAPAPTPPTIYTALVLGKRGIRPLLIDQDTPIITGAQQVLIAAAAADVFRKLGQPDQAAAFQQKAGASTDVLKAKNTDQAASAPRFVPQVEPRAYISELSCSW